MATFTQIIKIYDVIESHFPLIFKRLCQNAESAFVYSAAIMFLCQSAALRDTERSQSAPDITVIFKSKPTDTMIPHEPLSLR